MIPLFFLHQIPVLLHRISMQPFSYHFLHLRNIHPSATINLYIDSLAKIAWGLFVAYLSLMVLRVVEVSDYEVPLYRWVIVEE